MGDRVIFLVDMQSFYASIEKAARPELKHKPVVTADPSRKSGIILAACPVAKSYGITTAERVGEALAKCRDLHIIRPRMQTYIAVSLLITEICESFTDQVEPYSCDELFLDVTGSVRKYGSKEALARQIQERIMLATGIRARVGIGPTKILAKTATDNFAKASPEGLFELNFHNIEAELWPLPIHRMFMVASRMAHHFDRMGMGTIGDLARLELAEVKRRMRTRMGRQSDIQAEYYWQTARGIDPSPVVASVRKELQSVSHGKALRASLYQRLEDIEVVLLELVIEVCRRARRIGKQGRVVSVGAAETDGTRAAWFGRQLTLPHPTSLTHEVAAAALKLFRTHWSGLPVGRLYVSLDQLYTDGIYQLDLFQDRVKTYALECAMDDIKDRFGDVAILRASSLLEAGVARERAEQIGGHYR